MSFKNLLLQDDEVLTVGAFTRRVKHLLEGEIGQCWIRGEVSNLRVQQSGHVYFTLKDRDSQLSCVFFRGDAARQKIELQDGIQIVVCGEMSVYEPRGAYQLICRFALEEGAGRLQAEFERLKAKLDAEGLFAAEGKRMLPRMPRTVAFVTSPTGAAIQDFLSILKRLDWRGRIIVLPAKVQGAEAGGEIVEMIQRAEALGVVDLLVVGRGGGSLEDLWPFNEEPVVRAIAACSIPVVSAVGHEIDYTLADFVADVRAETPSAAAELISSGYLEARGELESLRNRILDTVDRHVSDVSRELSFLQRQLLSFSPQSQIENACLRLDELTHRLCAQAEQQLSRKQIELLESKHRLRALAPESRWQVAASSLQAVRDRYHQCLQQALASESQAVVSLQKRLENVGLQRVLKRGFAIARDSQGELVTRKAALARGDKLALDFQDGELGVTVTDL